MNYSRFAATLLFAGLLLAASPFAQQKELSFDSAGDFLSLPAELHLGEPRERRLEDGRRGEALESERHAGPVMDARARSPS